MVWIKICGFTNFHEALAAAAAGADALGFVFAPGPRRVGVDTAREIIENLPAGIEKIGVFVNEKPGVVAEIAGYCRLTGIQLHGEESPGYCRGFGKLNVIKSFKIHEKINGIDIAAYKDSSFPFRVLLDTYVPGYQGGTGKTFAWEMVSRYDWQGVPVIVAGGLNAGNVGLAIRTANPWGVDVSSGVEREPGRKDIRKIKEFINAVRGSVRE